MYRQFTSGQNFETLKLFQNSTLLHLQQNLTHVINITTNKTSIVQPAAGPIFAERRSGGKPFSTQCPI